MILYNELDPFAAQWLRNLTDAGAIPAGDVANCSLADLTTEQLDDLTQYHTFAGIGVWARALELAGWPSDMPVWTGSCPCQPFSLAGKGEGVEDDRHLWPIWRDQIAEHLPPIIFGEQVASPAGRRWLDVVSADLEALGYAVGSADLCAAGVGSPHIRQRLFFGAVRLADSSDPRLERYARHVRHGDQPGRLDPVQAGPAPEGHGPDGVGHTAGVGRPEAVGLHVPGGQQGPDVLEAQRDGEGSGVGDTVLGQPEGYTRTVYRAEAESPFEGSTAWRVTDQSFAPDALRDFWRRADWLVCRDPSGVPRWRPVERGTLPMAHGTTGRMGRLRAYGNAIVPQVAATFIASFVEAIFE